MAKISTYPSADNPLVLSDRLIGTEATRAFPSPIPFATKNFSLGDLLQLFSDNLPAPSLTATQIAFGGSSGLMTSSANLFYLSSGFGLLASNGDVSLGNNSRASINTSIADATSDFGDFYENGLANVIRVDDINSLAYYTNALSTGKFGINTKFPTVALDVVGDIRASNATYGDGFLVVSPINGYAALGDLGSYVNGNVIYIDDVNNIATYYNGTLTGKFGINNPAPTVALDVVGQAKISTLAGIGIRAVVADANGILSATTPLGTVTSVSGTALQIAVASGTTTPVISLVIGGTLPGAWALGTPASGILTNMTGYAGANLVLTDLTTNNTTTSAHGFFPKLTANSLYYVNNAGVLVPLTVGAVGTVLTGNGVTSAPTFATPTASVTALAAIGSTPNANAATLTGSTLNLEPASALFGGVLTVGAQTIAGVKTLTAPIFITSAQTPLIIGGTSTTQTLTYKTTTGVGATGADHIFQVGNNGATEAMRILNNGNVGIGTTVSTAKLHIKGAGVLSTDIILLAQNSIAAPSLVVLGNGYVGMGKTPNYPMDVAISNAGNTNSAMFVSGVSSDGRAILYGKADTLTQQLIYWWHTGGIGIGTGGSSNGGAVSYVGDKSQYGPAHGMYFFDSVGAGFGPNNIKYRLGISTSTTVSSFTAGVSNNLTNIESNTFEFTAKSHTFYTGTTIGNQSAPNQFTPLHLSSTGNVGINEILPTAKLHIKAPGALSTDIALRVRNSADTSNLMLVRGNGVYLKQTFITTEDTVGNYGAYFISGGAGLFNIVNDTYYASFPSAFNQGGQGFSFTSTPENITGGQDFFVKFQKTFVNNDGFYTQNQNWKPINLLYTINNGLASTGTATGIFLNATETALNGMTHNLMDLQVGGVSKFSVNRTGGLTLAGGIAVTGNITYSGVIQPTQGSCSIAVGQVGGVYSWNTITKIGSPSDGVITLSNLAITDFNRLQFGGTTNLFPSIKRNGAEFQFKLADDSAFTRIAVGTAQVAAKVGGTIFDYYTDVTVGGAETDIYSTTLLANTYNANGDKVISTYGGNFVTVGTELTQLKAYLAGTLIWDSTAMAVATGTSSWRIRVETIRVSTTVVRYTVSLNTSGAAGYVYAKSGELTGLTLSGTNILKITGTSSGAGSGVGNIVGKMGTVEWKPAA